MAQNRTYEQTHPWIKFRFDFKDAHALMWLGLGEAASKIEHLSKVPLQPDTAQKLHHIYLAKGAAATTAIEGNSLSEAQVLAAVQGKLEVPRSQEYLKQEIDNVIAVFNRIQNQIAKNELPSLTPTLICDYDLQVLNSLPLEEGTVPGVYRTHSVLVGTVYRGAPAQDCEYLMNRLCEWLDGSDFQAQKGLDVVYAIIKAIVAHLYLAWIHPFGDGNGRTARLVEFHILMSACVPAPAAHLLSNHYNQTRAEYYRQLDRASKSGGDILPFIEYAVQGLVDGLRTQLATVWDQNWRGSWQNYVHGLFQSGSGRTNTRRRNLALALGDKDGWIDVSAIRQLSPVLAIAYAGKGQKTIHRDINALNSMGVIERERKRVRGKSEIIFGLLPVSKKPAITPVIPIQDSIGQGLLSLLSLNAPESKGP